MNTRALAGLYAIADTRILGHAKLLPAVLQALAGGARIVQYRDKSLDHARREHEAGALRALCRAQGALFIVNDDPALARTVDADGVHLGRDDPSVAEARSLLGAAALIGVSCYNELARARAAETEGADYVAFGAFYPTRTKEEIVAAPLELLRAARAAIEIPIVAIGGITARNAVALIRAGADAVAAAQGLFGQRDTAAAARAYARLFDDTRRESTQIAPWGP